MSRQSIRSSHLQEARPSGATKSTVSRRLPSGLLLLCLILSPGAAAAQVQDVLGSAREAATSGRRAEALAALEHHLATVPRDVDARLLYGTILSWEGRYEEARGELVKVLAQAPAYADARVALMNVAWWSGDVRAAREAVNTILADDPGNQRAREVRDRLDAASRPWSAGLGYASDSFSDSREAWHELAATVGRLTPRGSVVVRTTETRRFGLDDRLIELEFYPRIRPGTYAFMGIGGASGSTLYPSHRIAFDLYQSAGAGFEVSGGFRRLGFDAPTTIYVGTVSKYLGNWMLTGKMFHVPGEGELSSSSYHGGFRRYIRGDGVSYIGLTYSHGFSREELRNAADLTTLDSDTVRGEIDQQIAGRYRVFATAGTSGQQRERGRLWQTSLTAGWMVQF
jgi:YaiO family outer membrane protein